MNIFTEFGIEIKENWSIALSGNSSIMTNTPSKLLHHFNFGSYSDLDNAPKLTSPHANILDEKESFRALMRLESLLRIYNGILMLNNRQYRKRVDSLIYEQKGNYRRLSPKPYREELGYIKSLDDEVEDDDGFDVLLEEMTNPFDAKVTNAIREKYPFYENSERYIIEKSIDIPMLKDVLIWRSICEEDKIHLITNAYKILDTVEKYIRDNNLKENNNAKSFIEAAKEFDKNYCSHMNTYNSSGLLGRHGYNSGEASEKKKKRITLKKIKSDLNQMILLWVNYLLLQDKDKPELKMFKFESD